MHVRLGTTTYERFFVHSARLVGCKTRRAHEGHYRRWVRRGIIEELQQGVDGAIQTGSGKDTFQHCAISDRRVCRMCQYVC